MSNPASPSAESPITRVLATIGIVAGIALCCLRGAIWSKGVINAEVFGYMAGGMFMAALIAWLVAWRSKAGKLGKFGLTFFIVSVVELLLELSSRTTHV
jgi:hypothetical protein